MLKTILIIFCTTLVAGFLVIGWYVFHLFKAWNGDGYSPVDKAVSDQYYTKENQVYFVSMGNFFSLGARKIEEADISSFRVLTTEYARDLKHIYFDGKIVDSVDIDSFQLLSRMHAKDKNSVYILGQREPRADLQTFEALGESYYAKDKNSVWYFYDIVEEADPQSFTALADPVEGEDQKNSFRDGRLVDES
ncbi:DKNYY domain-containing protein [Thalassolituus maritimus]|uniref:DKNYY family protein n=1 Tax=Thalassolituus maritimus TaxID=484498 RepID=A0ABP9ZYB7_9GAMM